MLNCPKCQSEQTQKVSIAYQSGVTNVNTITSSSGVILGGAGFNVGLGKGKTTGTMKTQLSQSISPPRKYSYKELFKRGFVFLIVSSIVITLLNIRNLYVSYFITFAIFFWMYKKYKDASTYNNNTFPRLLAQWNKNFICLRCGTIFEPGQQPK